MVLFDAEQVDGVATCYPQICPLLKYGGRSLLSLPTDYTAETAVDLIYIAAVVAGSTSDLGALFRP